MWGHKFMTPVQLELLSQGIIDIGGEVDDDMAMYVRESLMRLVGKGSPDINIIITSAGGSVSAGLAIYDALRLYQGKKTGKVVGFAKSMAVIILQACDKRQATQNSRILIHHVNHQVSLDQIRSQSILKKIREDLEESQSRIDKIILAKARISRIELKAVCEKDKEITAEASEKLGLIDEIL